MEKVRKKVVVISSCNQYPHFNYEYNVFNKKCELLDRKLKSNKANIFPIPSDCLLKNFEEE
jgi:hypothetical protein